MSTQLQAEELKIVHVCPYLGCLGLICVASRFLHGPTHHIKIKYNSVFCCIALFFSILHFVFLFLCFGCTQLSLWLLLFTFYSWCDHKILKVHFPAIPDLTHAWYVKWVLSKYKGKDKDFWSMSTHKQHVLWQDAHINSDFSSPSY